MLRNQVKSKGQETWASCYPFLSFDPTLQTEPHTVPDLPNPADHPLFPDMLQFLEASVEFAGVREGLPEISGPMFHFSRTSSRTTPPFSNVRLQTNLLLSGSDLVVPLLGSRDLLWTTAFKLLVIKRRRSESQVGG